MCIGRVALCVAFSVLLCAPANGQNTKLVWVGDRFVELTVAVDLLLVRPATNGERPTARISPMDLAHLAIEDQSRLTTTPAQPYAARLLESPPYVVQEANAILVPRFESITTERIRLIGSLGKDGLGDAQEVFRFQGDLVVPQGTVSVRFADAPSDDTLAQLRKEFGATDFEPAQYSQRVVRFRVADRSIDSFDVVSSLRKRAGVVWSAVDFVREAHQFAPPAPSDKYFNQQYFLSDSKRGINIPQEWWKARGGKVVVAVLDDGVDVSHEDLKEKLQVGYDFVKRADGAAAAPRDAHGTQCSGLIGAVTNNGKGIAGCGSGCSILPVRIVSGQNSPSREPFFVSEPRLAAAFEWAQRNGAKIINCSFGTRGGALSPEVPEAIDKVTKDGCIVVAAAGNAVPAEEVFFPASHPGVVAVGAVKKDGSRWEYSCYGPGNIVSFVAPSGQTNGNGDIFTTDVSGKEGVNPGGTPKDESTGDYTACFGGTSAAAPIVAGAMALVWSNYPDLPAARIVECFQLSATKVDPARGGWDHGRSRYYGWGKIDVNEALSKAKAFDAARLGHPQRTTTDAADTHRDIEESAKVQNSSAPDLRVRQLEAIQKPRNEVIVVGGEQRTLTPNERWITVILNVGANDKGLHLESLIEKRGIPMVSIVEQDDARAIAIVPRAHLLPVPELISAANAGVLLQVMPVYQREGALVIPLGSITCRVSAAGAVGVEEFARAHGLKVYSRQPDLLRLLLTKNGAFSNPFDAADAVAKLENVRWCHPDFARQVDEFSGGLKAARGD